MAARPRPNSVEYGNSKTTTLLPSAKCTRPLLQFRTGYEIPTVYHLRGGGGVEQRLGIQISRFSVKSTGVTNVSSREELSHPEMYDIASGFHHRYSWKTLPLKIYC